MTLAFWTAAAAVMLSFGFVLGWVARGAVVDLDQYEADGFHVGNWQSVGDDELRWVCDIDCSQAHDENGVPL